jgi:autotransporter-associated beta strand protein
MFEKYKNHYAPASFQIFAAIVVLPAAVWADPSPNAPKRGLGGSTASVSNAVNVNWYYDWGRTANTGQRGEFVPMAWNGGSLTNSTNYADLVNNTTSSYVLGFNEPERTDQANMSVATAISLWPKMMALKNPDGSAKKLVSPAVSDTTAGRAWMASFISEINRLNYRLDAIAFHWYGDVRVSNAANNFLGAVDYYRNTYTVAGSKLPVWITEFGGVDFTGGTNPVTPEMNETFLAGALPGLDSRSYVERYAWWNWSSESSLGSGSPFTPTGAGDLYNGRSYNAGTYAELDGLEGDDTFYLHGGAIQKSAGTATSVRFIDALDSASQIRGSANWNVENGWVRIRSGATIQKQGTNLIGFNGITVTNDGNLFVKGGTLELSSEAVVTGTGLMKTETGSTISLTGSGTTGITIDNDIQLAAGTLKVGGGSHTLNGDLIISNTSTFSVAGDFTVNGAITGGLNLTKTGSGTFHVNGIGTQTGTMTISAGTLELGDGTAGHDGTLASSSISLASGTTLRFNRFGTPTAASQVISGSGVVSKTGVGTQIVSGANTYTGVTSISAGTLRATQPAYNNFLNNSGGVNIGEGNAWLVLDYTGVTSPAATVKSLLTTSAANNFATGKIRSTSLLAGHTIGYRDDGVNTVTLRITLPGDADLNGKVDFNDFLALQNNFGVAGTRFDQGNFNYDGVTDFNDFLAMQNNFGQSITGTAVAFTSQQVAAMAAFAQSAAVPEPAVGGVLLIAASMLGRRRK